jgi:uncharacterized protein DUF11
VRGRICGLAVLVCALLPATALALPRSTVDRADDVGGSQIHAVYALPSDGTDRALDTDGTLADSVASFETWLASKADGRSLRLDTYQGQLDISFIQLPETSDEIRARDPFIRDFIQQQLHAAGFNGPNKIYAAYYDGQSDFSCGGGAWPPTLPGDTAALYLDGLWDQPVPCRDNPFDRSPGHDNPTYLEFAMLHEIMHTLGVVPTCAPNHWRAGHVFDDANDLMWAGDGNWIPDGWDAVKLDSGNDDYFKHSNGSCLDFDDSAFLTSSAGCVSWAGGDGNWTDAAKWSTGVVPTASDDVCITAPSTYTVTLAGSRSVRSLNLGGAAGTQTLAVQGGASPALLTAAIASSVGAHGRLRLESTGVAGSATVHVQAGTLANSGTISSVAGAGGARGIEATLANAGLLEIFQGTTLDSPVTGVTQTNTGTVDVESGAMLAVAETYRQTAGLTRVDGTLDPPALTLDGGRLLGSGTVAAPVTNNLGTVAPGASPGILTIAGAFTQGKKGTLELELNGTTAGTGYDVLAVTGAATLKGKLKLLTGFAIADGQSFSPITWGSRAGTFKPVDGQFPTSSLGYALSYGTGGLNLLVRKVADLRVLMTAPPSVPLNQSFSYSIEAKNLGPNPTTGTKVVAALKSPLVYESATTSKGTCKAKGVPAKVTCTLGTLAPNEIVTITITVHATAKGAVANVASGSATELDPNATNNKASVTTTIT